LGELTKSIDGLRELKKPLDKLRISIETLPSGFHSQKITEKLAEEWQKKMGAAQRRATGGNP
jgi:hypothetical protein